MLGTVKWFNAQRGYGFIKPDDGSEDYLFMSRHGGIMTQHKFKIGQIVEFLPNRLDPLSRNVPRGNYAIERLLPGDTGNLQYRVKHTVDGHQRVLAESELGQPAIMRAPRP